MLPIVLGIGLLNGCFGLTIAAKPPKTTKVEELKQEEKFVLYFDYYFKNLGMEKYFGNLKNPAKFKGDFSKLKVLNKSDVNNALALFIMIREVLSESAIKTLKEDLEFKLVNLVVFNFYGEKIGVLGTSASPGTLSKKEVNEFKRILTKENLRKVEITAKKLKKAKEYIISKLEGVTLNYNDRVKEIKNAKLEDVKNAAKDFADCKLRIEKVFPGKNLEYFI